MRLVWTTVCLAITVIRSSLADECVTRDFFQGGTVCVCNVTHCDTFKSIEKVDSPKYVKVTSNKAGLRFYKEEGDITPIDAAGKNVITIKDGTYQKIFGFGGAFTDATGINIKYLSDELQEVLLRAYFSDDGLEYNVGRVPIGGTDFSLEPYSYCDTENNTADPELVKFNLTSYDYEYKIPIIQRAIEHSTNGIDLFASAWIAPNWMKTIPEFEARESYLKEEMYQAWANYFVKFLDSYENNNISFWGITTGNEPLTAFVSLTDVPSVAWTPDTMAKWIKNNLGPTLKNAYPNIQLLTLDDSRVLLPVAIDLLFLDPEVKKFIDGIGIHWYSDVLIPPEVLNITHQRYPDKFILATESCAGYIQEGVKLGKWQNAELYAKYILEDLNNWVTGWTDWNMVLNTEGGPTYINNFVDAPIIISANQQEFYKQPMYYAMGHFSKFLPKESVRLEYESVNVTLPLSVFKRPDGGTVAIILNNESADVPVTIRDPAKGDIVANLSSHSVTSIVYW